MHIVLRVLPVSQTTTDCKRAACTCACTHVWLRSCTYVCLQSRIHKDTVLASIVSTVTVWIWIHGSMAAAAGANQLSSAAGFQHQFA